MLVGVEQTPNVDWHPAPQWSDELPQNPAAEQQSPKGAPVQTLPLEPQRPSVVTLVGAEQSPKVDWQPALQWVVELPQKPSGEQQSPNGEDLHVFPFLLPHSPSSETLPASPQVPNPVTQPAPQCVVEFPQ